MLGFIKKLFGSKPADVAPAPYKVEISQSPETTENTPATKTKKTVAKKTVAKKTAKKSKE